MAKQNWGSFFPPMGSTPLDPLLPPQKRAPDGKPLFGRTPIKGSNPRKRASETPQMGPPPPLPDLGSKSEVKIIVCNIFLKKDREVLPHKLVHKSWTKKWTTEKWKSELMYEFSHP